MDMNNICKLCGKPIDLHEYEPAYEIPQLMKAKHVCWNCGFWLNRIERDKSIVEENPSKIPLIFSDWSHWLVDKDKTFGTVSNTFVYTPLYATTTYFACIHPVNKKAYIMQHNNLSHQGTIPEHLRSQFKINAVILTPEDFQQLAELKDKSLENIENLINKSII